MAVGEQVAEKVGRKSEFGKGWDWQGLKRLRENSSFSPGWRKNSMWLRRPDGAQGLFSRFSQDFVRCAGLHPGLFSLHPSGMRDA
jgi:hypothetical protein